MNKLCYIIGASPKQETYPPIFESNALVIAADGGLTYLEEIGVKADVAIGDFDSLGYIPDSCEVISYPAEKDDTDMMLAIRYAISKGYSDFRIYRGLGSRLDHTIANIEALNYLAKNNCRGYLYDNKTTLTVIHSNSIEFDESKQGVISIFALDEKVYGVDIIGLKYILENSELSNSFPLGISNEFIGQKSSVSAKSGSLLIITIEE